MEGVGTVSRVNLVLLGATLLLGACAVAPSEPGSNGRPAIERQDVDMTLRPARAHTGEIVTVTMTSKPGMRAGTTLGAVLERWEAGHWRPAFNLATPPVDMAEQASPTATPYDDADPFIVPDVGVDVERPQLLKVPETAPGLYRLRKEIFFTGAPKEGVASYARLEIL
jgi:hypothetical protein